MISEKRIEDFYASFHQPRAYDLDDTNNESEFDRQVDKFYKTLRKYAPEYPMPAFKPQTEETTDIIQVPSIGDYSWVMQQRRKEELRRHAESGIGGPCDHCPWMDKGT